MSLTIYSDSYSPIGVGDTLNPLSVQFWTHQNGLPVAINLTGLTLSMKMQNEAGTVKVCTASWVIDSVSAGLAHYSYNSADVSAAGIWTLFIELQNGSGQVAHAYTKILEILNVP